MHDEIRPILSLELTRIELNIARRPSVAFWRVDHCHFLTQGDPLRLRKQSSILVDFARFEICPIEKVAQVSDKAKENQMHHVERRRCRYRNSRKARKGRYPFHLCRGCQAGIEGTCFAIPSVVFL